MKDSPKLAICKWKRFLSIWISEESMVCNCFFSCLQVRSLREGSLGHGVQKVPVINFNLAHLKIEPLRGISTIEPLSNQLLLCKGCFGPGKFWTNKRKEPLSMELLSGIFCNGKLLRSMINKGNREIVDNNVPNSSI